VLRINWQKLIFARRRTAKKVNLGAEEKTGHSK
jgi:hypothetical protein